MITHKFNAFLLPKNHTVAGFVDKEAQKGIFVYKFGAVIFWNVPVEMIAQIINKDYKPLTTEDFIIEFSENAEPKVEFNKLILNTYNLERIEAVAKIIAQSVTLEHFEQIVDSMSHMANIPISFTALSQYTKKMDEVLNVEEDMVFNLKLLEKPEITWNDATLDQLYDELQKVFDLQSRVDTVEYKLSCIEKKLDRKITLSAHHRSLILEVLVVIFFIIEIIPTVWTGIQFLLGR